jgi:hypothetical protein
MGYPSDLTDAEWALIEHYFQPRDRRGSASLHPRKRIVASSRTRRWHWPQLDAAVAHRWCRPAPTAPMIPTLSAWANLCA